ARRARQLAGVVAAIGVAAGLDRRHRGLDAQLAPGLAAGGAAARGQPVDRAGIEPAPAMPGTMLARKQAAADVGVERGRLHAERRRRFARAQQPTLPGPICHPHIDLYSILIKFIDMINIRPDRRTTTMELHLADLMNPTPLTAVPTDSLAAAAHAMRARDVSSAVIVREGTVLGILTERDLARACAAGAPAAEAPVTGWMTPDPVTMGPDCEVTVALERMLERNVRHLPVCDGGRLVGTVSLRQLVRAASLRRVDPWTPGTARGLENVTVAETRLSLIDATGGHLIYAGYDAVRLARERSFEDVWHLLLHDALPADDDFAARLRTLRELPLPASTLRALATTDGAMMSKLEAATTATGAARGLTPWYEREPSEIEEESVRLAAVVP